MILDKPGAQYEYEGSTFTVGNTIVVLPGDPYQGLFGKITEIRSGEDMETDNEFPDIYCELWPPTLDCDIKKLEDTFSSLYFRDMKLEDIALDLVILPPTGIRELHRPDRSKIVEMYLLDEDWAVKGESGRTIRLFSDYYEAKLEFDRILEEEREEGCVCEWLKNPDFDEDSFSDDYTAFLQDDYLENHFAIRIRKYMMAVSDNFIGDIPVGVSDLL